MMKNGVARCKLDNRKKCLHPNVVIQCWNNVFINCDRLKYQKRKEAQPWWKYLDWSTMRNTYPKLSKELQKRIFDEGYWSLGKGRFEEEKAQP